MTNDRFNLRDVSLRRLAARAIGIATIFVMLAAPAPVAADSVSEQARADATAAVFDDLLDQLRSNNLDEDPRLISLVDDLERYHRHVDEARREKQKLFDTAMATMAQEADEDDLLDALGAAIEAQGVAAEPDAFLTDPRVAKLIDRAEHAAERAHENGEWIEELSLYIRLNLLHEPNKPYLDRAKRATERVRILGLYAPQRLWQMQAERARRLGEPEPREIDIDRWQDVLKGINFRMLQRVISQADKHISGRTAPELLVGAIDGLLLMLEVKGIEETFPALNDRDKVHRFRDFLLTRRAELHSRKFRMFSMHVNSVLKRIVNKNKETVGLPEQVVIYELADGAVNTLDKFSEVIWPYRLEQFKRNTDGDFTGVGVQISMIEEELADGDNAAPRRRIKVVTPITGTPARRAGLRPGDIIAEVNGEDTTSWTLDKAVRSITGPAGTTVDLGIERTGHEQLIPVTLTRQRVPLESIWGWQRLSDEDWDYCIDQESRIGYIRLTSFLPQTEDELDAAVNSMLEGDGLKGLILDLRFNPGGLLNQAVAVANRFIDSGRIVSTVDRENVEAQTYRSWPNKAYPDMPLVVLVNAGSASASEIVAGALQDYGRATIIGDRSYGKGSVQDLYPVADEAVLKLTTQYYKLPGGRIIHREEDSVEWGIDPDMIVKTADEQAKQAIEMRLEADILRDWDNADDPDRPYPVAQRILDTGVDPQLETALVLLKTRILADTFKLALGEPVEAAQ